MWYTLAPGKRPSTSCSVSISPERKMARSSQAVSRLSDAVGVEAGVDVGAGEGVGSALPQPTIRIRTTIVAMLTLKRLDMVFSLLLLPNPPFGVGPQEDGVIGAAIDNLDEAGDEVASVLELYQSVGTVNGLPNQGSPPQDIPVFVDAAE